MIDILRRLYFQFHKGTIKALCRSMLTKIVLSFNSIKVQLRQSSDMHLQRDFISFNSIKVQLRRLS